MITISKFTEDLLSLREKDDVRISMIKDVLFSDDIGGICKDRTFDRDGDSAQLSKAVEGDTLNYLLISDPKMIRLSIDSNIRNVDNLRKAGQIKLRNTFIILFEMSDNSEELVSEVIVNPTSADSNDIVKGTKEIVSAFVIFEYMIPNEKGEDIVVRNFNALSQGDPERLNEYNNFIIKNECKHLENAFWIDFNDAYDKSTPEFKESLLSKAY